MKIKMHGNILLLVCGIFLLLAAPPRAAADEMLALYGLKGYAYVYSPLVVKGFQVQTGTMYSLYHKNNLNCRDGYIWATPLSLTFGDGDRWEAAAAIQWEYWKNTDFDVDETGVGDLFLGGKYRFLRQEQHQWVDLALMPYLMIPTGDRDKAIGDLYLFNPSDEDDFSYGMNVLLGKRLERVYVSLNIGFNYVNTDHEDIKNTTLFFGLGAEYHISETWNGYLEFVNNENKNRFNYPGSHYCYDAKANEDIREIGAGLVWLKNRLGLKLHTAVGFTETAPDFRVLGLVN